MTLYTEVLDAVEFAPAVTEITALHIPTDEHQAALHLAFPRLARIAVQSAP